MSAPEGVIDAEVSTQEVVLTGAPSAFRVTPPHQFLNFFSQAPFFYEDRRRTFLVVPEEVSPSTDPSVLHAEHVSLGLLANVRSMSLFTGEPTTPRDSPALVPQPSGVPTAVFAGGDQNLVIDRHPAVMVGRGEFEDDSGIDVESLALESPAQPQAAHALDLTGPAPRRRYRFLSFYHPYTCLFIEQVNRFGVSGLLGPEPEGQGLELFRQLTPGSAFRFSATYGPTGAVRSPAPVEEIDFSPGGAYGVYNWELFFHLPLLVASRLSTNQRFAEAQQWYHYVFDPTETSEAGLQAAETARRAWKLKPFAQFGRATSIDEIVRLVSEGDADYENEVARWEEDPFNPHRVASLRTVAYMKLVVMKYVENLIAWGDDLFRQDTIESVNEATQLYVLATELLGRRPVEVPGREPSARSFEQLRAELDVLSNALVQLEGLIQLVVPKALGKSLDRGAAGNSGSPAATTSALAVVTGQGSGASATFTGTLPFLPPTNGGPDTPVLYFGVPHNAKLAGYWTTLADRLFKVRHCLNIEGAARVLDFFEPPLDPALLVRAAAAGVDPASAVNDLNAPLPHYRFMYLVQRAAEFCADVKALGAALLATLEKKDAEALAALRAGQQTDLLSSTRKLKEQSIAEAREALEGLRMTREAVEHREQHYGSLLKDRGSTARKSERKQVDDLAAAARLEIGRQGVALAAGVIRSIGDFQFGTAGWAASPLVTYSMGGASFAAFMDAAASSVGIASTVQSNKSTRSGMTASDERRTEEWIFQREQASRELLQLDRQIDAAEIRVEMAEREQDILVQQITQAREEDAFLQAKFTNEQLYGRLAAQVSTVYFQSYGLAYDLAKRAERCFRYETGTESTGFIQPGSWDNLTKGLHAGERLLKDLRSMEFAYLEQNGREYEITQHLSLALLNPRRCSSCVRPEAARSTFPSSPSI